MIYVNVYEVNRHYGGPEEGGWWFDSEEPQLSIKLQGTQDFKADQFYNDMEQGELPPEIWTRIHNLRQALEAEFPVGKGYRLSMRPQGTDYLVLVEDEEAKRSPEEWPHYE